MSMAEFFTMGGFAVYIGSSFAVALALIVIEVVMLRQQRKNCLQRLHKLQRIKQGQMGNQA